MSSQDDLNTSAIAVAGLVGAVVVFAVIVLLMVVFYQVEARQQQAKDVDPAYTEVGTLLADQEGRLASYGWVDQEKQIAFIPIGRAMELVVAELSRGGESAVGGGSPDDTKEDEEDVP